MDGTIGRIRAYPEKGAEGTELGEARLIENLGLEGDYHASNLRFGGGERQISLFLSESREQMAGAKEKGLCFLRFRENITLSGLAAAALKPGVCLAAGEAVLEITGETKRCHEECALYEAGKRCALAGQNLFAKVLKGGVIRAGDRIEVVSANTREVLLCLK